MESIIIASFLEYGVIAILHTNIKKTVSMEKLIREKMIHEVMIGEEKRDEYDSLRIRHLISFTEIRLFFSMHCDKTICRRNESWIVKFPYRGEDFHLLSFYIYFDSRQETKSLEISAKCYD